MKQSDRIDKLEHTVVDLRRQLRDIRATLNIKGEPELDSFAVKLHEMIMKRKDIPYFKDRDLFSPTDMVFLAGQAFSEEQLSEFGIGGAANNKNRVVSKKLVDSGLWHRLRGQFYAKGDVDSWGNKSKPYSRKQTVLVMHNLNRYKKMTENQLYEEMTRQQHISEYPAPVANEVSFL